MAFDLDHCHTETMKYGANLTNYLKGVNEMLVKNWMSKDVITIEANDSMSRATNLLKEHDIRMLPVMKNGKLVGVVTDRDLKRASASDATTLEIHELLYLISHIKIKEIMTKAPVTVHPDITVEETPRCFWRIKYRVFQ